MSATEVAIVPNSDVFSHHDAQRVYDLAMEAEGAHTVVVDLKHAGDASTSAFARLVLLRGQLLRVGRDLRLCGLRDRTAHVYKINRLGLVLPLQ